MAGIRLRYPLSAVFQMFPRLLYVTLLAILLTATLFGGTQLVFEGKRARVTSVTVTGREYTVKASTPSGSVWVALDNGVLIQRGEDGSGREVRAGETGLIAKGDVARFGAPAGRTARLVIVEIREAMQMVTVESETLNSRDSLEDASDRNETLLISLSTLWLRDVRGLGNGSQWIPGKPQDIRMRPAHIKWIDPGIHHWSNLLRTSSSFVIIEW